MQHRAVQRVTPAGAARTSAERDLERVQARVAAARASLSELERRRDAIALSLWLDHRMPQAEIAERLDRADRAAGGVGVGYAAVQKRLYRLRWNGDA